MATPTAPTAIAKRIDDPSIDLYFVIYGRKSFTCYYQLFKILKSEHNFIIYYKDESLSYSIPLYKRNSEILLIINNICIQKSLKYKLCMFLNSDHKKTYKSYKLNKLLNQIFMLYDSFSNVNYNLL